MLKIAIIETSGQAVTLRLEGRVIGPWVEELRRSCERALDRGGRLTLDLAHVSFIDRDGIALFRDLGDHRVAMAAGLLSLRVPGCLVENPGCVAKSYPAFFSDLTNLALFEPIYDPPHP